MNDIDLDEMWRLAGEQAQEDEVLPEGYTLLGPVTPFVAQKICFFGQIISLLNEVVDAINRQEHQHRIDIANTPVGQSYDWVQHDLTVQSLVKRAEIREKLLECETLTIITLVGLYFPEQRRVLIAGDFSLGMKNGVLYLKAVQF